MQNERTVGIIGAGADKFTKEGMARAKTFINQIVDSEDFTAVVSGRSPMGGVDIWAEEAAEAFGKKFIACEPRSKTWGGNYGYRARNLDIARKSDYLYVVVVDGYPKEYTGQRFARCYHCNTELHVKSGACWTAKQKKKMSQEEPTELRPVNSPFLVKSNVSWQIIRNTTPQNAVEIRFDSFADQPLEFTGSTYTSSEPITRSGEYYYSSGGSWRTIQ